MVPVLFLLFSTATSTPQTTDSPYRNGTTASPHIIDCLIDQEECEIGPNNLINTYLGIESIEECKLLCEDEFNCVAFTHFGSAAHPFPDGCLLFSSCTERRPCQDCATGSSQTDCRCSISYAGDVTPDNFVNLLGGVPDELACKMLCNTYIHCDLYTFYDREDLMQPETCVLLTSSGLQKAVEPCQNCFTGPGQCKVNQTCQAAAITNGTVTNVVFAEQSSTVTLVANEKGCFVDLDVVAIGGGGNYVNGYARGAGSGFVEEKRVRLSINSPVMEITVGSNGTSSKVEVGGEVVLEAAPGEDPNSVRGGDGFSGGGGRGGQGGSPRGGSDGGDGEDGSDSAGGRGSGLDIGLLASESFSLTPGEGGVAMADGHGGGGGGVIVNGKKPGEHTHAGEGFGGGGAGNQKLGFPGCVLVKFN